jgi:hypothetical protein
MAKKKKLPKTWEQYYRRESNKYQVIDDFIAQQLERVVDTIEKEGLTGRNTLLFLSMIDKEFDTLADSCEFERGWKIKRGMFPSVLLQTCLNGKEHVHVGFAQNVANLYHLMGWSYVDSLSPKTSPLEDTRWVNWTHVGGVTHVEIVVYDCTKFPVGSVWRSSKGNRWEILSVDGDSITMVNIEPWGNKREMVFSDRVVLSMKRVI